MTNHKPSVDSVAEKFETSVKDPNPDRSNFTYHDAMKDANKLSDVEQKLLGKKLVEAGILPDLAIKGSIIRTADDATVLNMLKKANNGEPKNFEQRLAMEMSTDKEHLDAAKQLLKGKESKDAYVYRTRSQSGAEVANVERQFDSLLTKSNAQAKGRDFLTKEDLAELKKDPKLTAGESRAVKFLQDNYDKLETRWTGKSENGITKKHLSQYAKENLGTTDDRVRTAKRVQIEQDVLKKSQHQVGKEGSEGYWGIAKLRLSENNGKPTNADIAKEMIRLQKLNPDKKVFHQGDKIRTQSEADVEKEIQKRLRAA